MTAPWSVAKEYELHLYPPGLVLMGIKGWDVLVENIFGMNQATWRSYLPFGLGSAPWSWYSIDYAMVDFQADMQHLETYSEFDARVCSAAGAVNERSLSLPHCLYQFAFETPNTELSDVTRMRTFVLVIFLVMLMQKIKMLGQPKFSLIGETLARQSLGEKWVSENPERIFKFGEYVFRLCFHSCMALFGVLYFWDKPWWTPRLGGTKNLWLNYGNQPVDVGMIWYYLLQCAYNLEAMVYLLSHSVNITFLNRRYLLGDRSSKKETKGLAATIGATMGQLRYFVAIEWSKKCRGDFTEMFVHHCLTNVLLLLSSQIMGQRQGSMCFVIHDLSDVPVDLSKLANFLKWKKTTISCFALMCVGWIVCRLWILPFYIMYSTIYEVNLVTDARIASDNSMYSEEQYRIIYKAWQSTISTMIGLLVALHLFWFSLFLKMFYVLLKKGEACDLSENKKKAKWASISENSSDEITVGKKDKIN